MLPGQFHGTKIRHQVFRRQYLVPLDNEKISKKTRSVYNDAEMTSLAFECDFDNQKKDFLILETYTLLTLETI